jgi:hypothetical protein
MATNSVKRSSALAAGGDELNQDGTKKRHDRRRRIIASMAWHQRQQWQLQRRNVNNRGKWRGITMKVWRAWRRQGAQRGMDNGSLKKHVRASK